MTTNPFQIKFTLKQHTPIIHFQHEQEGATLRATEVKPKLDRFIIQKMKEDNKPVPDSWYNNKEKASLDYKLRIDSNYTEKEAILNFHKNAPMYFGNMGNENPPKHFKTKDKTEVIIFCINRELREKLEEYMVDFFFKNNFGTRQSKGYGSFQVIEMNKKEEKVIPEDYNFSFTIQTGKWQEALLHVNLFYKALRSGINAVSKISYVDPSDNTKAHKQQNTASKFYFKSLLFLYAKHLNKQWDKKTIKQVYFNSYAYRYLSDEEKANPIINWNNGDIEFMEELGLTQQITKHASPDILTFSETNTDNHFFLDYKDVFGLSSAEQWKSYGKQIVKNNAQNCSTPSTFSEKDKTELDFVERFKSPLFFKPIQTGENEFTIYVSYTELPNDYKGQKFIIYNNAKGLNPRLCLKIPDSFKFSEFFEFIFDKANINLENHVSDNNHKKEIINANGIKVNYYEALMSIFKQLQKK